MENSNLLNFYKFTAFSSFAAALLSIFIPVYLLNNGLLLNTIIIFLLINYLSIFFIVNISSFLFKKINIKYLIITSSVLMVLYYFLIYNFKTLNINIYLIGVLSGISFGLFWLCYHIFFSLFGDNKSRGTQSSFTFILRSVTSFIAPFIAVLILYLFDFVYLFSFSILILILNFYNLYKFEKVELNFNSKFKDIYKQNFKDYIGFFGHGILIGSGILWSIHIFVNILNDYILLGLVTFVSLLIATITRIFIGKLSDKNSSKTLKYGAFSNLVVWLFKPFIATSFGVFIIDFFDGITDSVKNIPFNSKAYNNAKNTNIFNFNIFRESLIAVGVISIYSIYLISGSFQITFIVSAFSSLLYLSKV